MNTITVETIVHSPVESVWKFWNEPEHITHWAFASDDWEAPHAESDAQTGGKFLTRMAAKDGSAAFDFTGTFTEVLPNERIAYAMEDGRKVTVLFDKIDDNNTRIVETFDPETINPEEMQRAGWQAILENFRKYAESK